MMLLKSMHLRKIGCSLLLQQSANRFETGTCVTTSEIQKCGPVSVKIYWLWIFDIKSSFKNVPFLWTYFCLSTLSKYESSRLLHVSCWVGKSYYIQQVLKPGLGCHSIAENLIDTSRSLSVSQDSGWMFCQQTRLWYSKQCLPRMEGGICEV